MDAVACVCRRGEGAVEYGYGGGDRWEGNVREGIWGLSCCVLFDQHQDTIARSLSLL